MRAGAVLAALILAGCASPPPPTGSAALTLFGPGARLEMWSSAIVDGAHVHPVLSDDPCPFPAIGELMRKTPAPIDATRREQMGAMVESLCTSMYGKPYGGPGRTSIVLRRRGADEALVIELPLLAPAEQERLFKPSELKAVYERPLKTAEAAFDHGWVRAVRGHDGRAEYDLFLVLKPLKPGAAYEAIQAVARVSPPRR